MSLINETFNIFSVFDCRYIEDIYDVFKYDSMWRQNVIGCHMLNILKEYYKFSTSYVIPDKSSNWTNGAAKKFLYDDKIDIYAYPMSLINKDWDNVYPLQFVMKWKFGFLIRRLDKEVFRRYYMEPFSSSVWLLLYLLCFLIPLLFYIISKWERQIYGINGECSYLHELLITIGGYCQIILPVEPRLPSRRFAYSVFYLFTFVIHNFFNSELLSHLVYKTDNVYDIFTLMDNNFKFAMLPDIKLILKQNEYDSYKIGLLKPYLNQASTLNASEGLKAVTRDRTALLCDYFSLYPLMKTSINTETLCQLTEVDIKSNILKYFFTSKKFRYKEEFKISILRAKETGLVSKLNQNDFWQTSTYSNSAEVQATFTQIYYPLLNLWCSCVLSTAILLVERWWYFRKCTVLPHAE